MISGEDAAAAAKKAAKAKGGDQPFSRIPGLRDASKKMAKIVSKVLGEKMWHTTLKISVETYEKQQNFSVI